MTVHYRDQVRLALPTNDDALREAGMALADRARCYADRCGYLVLFQQVELLDEVAPDRTMLLVADTELIVSTEGEWPSVHAAFAEDGWSR